MNSTDTQSLQIFEDMKAGIVGRGYDESELIITEAEPLRYEVQMKTSLSEDSCTATLWARYIPDCRQVWAGVTFPEQIPEERIREALSFANEMNRMPSLGRLTLCPICRRMDLVAGLFLIRARLPREKFQIMSSVCESNAFFYHPEVRRMSCHPPDTTSKR